MGRLSRRHFVLLAISAAWFAITCWSWRTLIPVVPSFVTQLDGRVAIHPGGPSNTVLLHRWGKSVVQDPSWGSWRSDQVPVGPLHVCDLATGSILHQSLDDHDQILHVSPDEAPRVAVARGETLRVAEVPTGRTLWHVPLGELKYVRFAARGQVLLAQRKDELTAYDAQTGNVLWARPVVMLATSPIQTMPAAALFPVLIQNAEMIGTPGKQKPAVTSSRRLFDARTGNADERFPGFPDVRTIELSPNGRWLAVDTSPTSRLIFDSQSGRHLWTLTGRRSYALDFSPDSREVRMSYRTADHRFGHARWNCADGKLLADAPPGASPTPAVDVGPDQILYSEPHAPGQALPPVVQKWLNRIGLPRWSRLLVVDMNRQVWRLVNRETGAAEGILPDNVRQIIRRPENHGFTAVTPTQILSFDLSPRRNWLWLWTRGLVPPVVIWVAVSAVIDWRTRRKQLDPNLTSEHRTPDPFLPATH
jgi:hypothetical protein